MLHDILGHRHLQLHPQLIRQYTNVWSYYRTGPYYGFWPFYQISWGFHRTLQRVWLADRGRLLLRTPCPVPFGTCICFNVMTILSWSCHVYGPFEFRTSLSTSILLVSPEIRTVARGRCSNYKGLFRVKMHSLLLRPGSDNSISLWCKLRHTIDLSTYRSWFPFWDNCFVWLKFSYFIFFETCTQPFCKRHYPVIVITLTRHVLYAGKCTRLYILEIIKAWPLCILWTRGHAYHLTQLYKFKTFG